MLGRFRCKNIYYSKGLSLILAFLILILYTLHPGFKVAPYSLISTLGFICFFLVIPVFILMLDEVLNIIREIKRRIVGPYFVKIDKISSALVSPSIGAENLIFLPIGNFRRTILHEARIGCLWHILAVDYFQSYPDLVQCQAFPRPFHVFCSISRFC
ncbi:MAG: hypothetical protein DRJ64_02750 [Thermoprotei archaeon]|nr:MAG: hypothetical protein DRJ64_02750 [Thermoprotei archaeon]